MGTRYHRADHRVCAQGVFGDYSLCGDALEGDGEDVAPVVRDAEHGTITCPRCCDIIAHVRVEFKGATVKKRNR